MEAGEIRSAWRQLVREKTKKKGAPTDIVSIETQTVVASGAVRLALVESRIYSVLLPIPLSESVEPDQTSQLVTVRPVDLGVEGQTVRFLEVRCEEESLVDVFAKVASDILSRIESGANSQMAVAQAMDEFRRLLHRQRFTQQDENAVVGLIGELMTLIELLAINSNAVTSWHGPASDRHDFRAGNVAVEVKTSIGADGNRVHINGMLQLDRPADEALVVRHVRIEPDPDGALCVPDLVAAAASLCSDVKLLDEKLEKLGYSVDSQDRWAGNRYRHISSNAFDVQDGFPRLIPALLNVEWPVAGVSNVSYEVDLGAASEYLLDAADWDAKVVEISECV